MIHKGRIQRTQELMQQNGIDAYLILTHDDYIYFFGEDRYQPCAVIPAAGTSMLITFRREEDEMAGNLGVNDVWIFGTVGQQIKEVVDLMRELKGDRPRRTVGVQMWFSMPAFLYPE